eukprot:Clim_evm16s14 gene=Clim_evmTU16s14
MSAAAVDYTWAQTQYQAMRDYFNDDSAMFSIVLVAIIHSLVWGYGLLNLYMIHNKWMWQYRIQGEKLPKWELIRDAMIHSAISHSLAAPVFSYILFPLYAHEDNYDVRFSAEAMPSLFTMFWQVWVFIFIEDTLFYWGHRWFHSHPTIYKIMHKTHHKFHIPCSIGAEYATPWENLFANVAPMYVGPMFIPSHFVTLMVWNAVRLGKAMDAHSGYSFPWSPSQWAPGIFNTVNRHDYHHSQNKGCFASFLTFWDRLCGTDETYRQWSNRKALEAKAKAKAKAIEKED